MDDLGIDYDRVHIESPVSIYSDKLGQSISNIWKHYAVRIWDTIYDNINPKWINLNMWKDDLWFGSFERIDWQELITLWLPVKLY